MQNSHSSLSDKSLIQTENNELKRLLLRHRRDFEGIKQLLHACNMKCDTLTDFGTAIVDVIKERNTLQAEVANLTFKYNRLHNEILDLKEENMSLKEQDMSQPEELN